MYKTSFKTLKEQAKADLLGKYWWCVLVVLILMVVSGLIGGIASVGSMLIAGPFVYLGGETADPNIANALTLLPSIIIQLVMIPISIFLLIPLVIGITRYFVNVTKNTENINDMMFAFKNRYGNVVLTNFLASLYAFLWSLLLIIPGIIKSYEYSMIPYIMAENPAIDRKRAFEVSKALTDGNKWRIFLFGLSFIGWILLSVLTCGIGYIFLVPYMEAAYVRLYFDLKLEAAAKGTISDNDFIYEEIQ